MTVAELVGQEVTLFFWNGQTRHEVHGFLDHPHWGCYRVKVGRVMIEFEGCDVKRVGMNNIWLED